MATERKEKFQEITAVLNKLKKKQKNILLVLRIYVHMRV